MEMKYLLWVIACGFLLHPPVRSDIFKLSKYCFPITMPICTIRNMTYNEDTSSIEPELLEKVTQVQFIDSNLRRMPKIFHILPNLMKLIAQNSRIESITNRDFQRALHVKILDLTVNHIKEVPDRAFAALLDLEDLRLGFNEIHSLTTNSFEGANRVTDLIINNNRLEKLPIDVFAPLKELEYINLEHNRIDLVDAATFQHNVKLKTILLNNNNLIVFASSSLAHIPAWNLIDVSYNIINKISLQSVHTFKAFRSHLTECNITGPVTRLIMPNNFLKKVNISNPDNIRELDIRGNLFGSLADFGELRNLEILDASWATFYDISAFSRMKSLQELRLAGANLSSKQENLLDLSQEIVTLDLSENYLLHFNPEHLRVLKKLERLYVDKNEFRDFPYQILKEYHPNLSELSIAGNLFNCSYLADIQQYCQKNDIVLKIPYRFVEWSSTAGVNCHQDRSPKKIETKVKEKPGEDPASIAVTVFSTFFVTMFIVVVVLTILNSTNYLTINSNRSPRQEATQFQAYNDGDVML